MGQPFLALITPLSGGGQIDNTLPGGPPGHVDNSPPWAPGHPGNALPGGGHIDNSLPGGGHVDNRPPWAPALPGHDLPWAPARPGHDLPWAPGHPGNRPPGSGPDGGAGQLPSGGSGYVFAFLPGTGWTWVAIDTDASWVWGYVAGVGWTWIPVAGTEIDNTLPPAGETKPVEPPPPGVDAGLPPTPEPK